VKETKILLYCENAKRVAFGPTSINGKVFAETDVKEVVRLYPVYNGLISVVGYKGKNDFYNPYRVRDLSGRSIDDIIAYGEGKTIFALLCVKPRAIGSYTPLKVPRTFLRSSLGYVFAMSAEEADTCVVSQRREKKLGPDKARPFMLLRKKIPTEFLRQIKEKGEEFL